MYSIENNLFAAGVLGGTDNAQVTVEPLAKPSRSLGPRQLQQIWGVIPTCQTPAVGRLDGDFSFPHGISRLPGAEATLLQMPDPTALLASNQPQAPKTTTLPLRF